MVRKVVFPVAGLGTRFLPATKANPKEMLPVVDKPLIQYAVEEAVAAGAEELIFVTSSAKRAIEDHFDRNLELESELARKGDEAMLEMVRGIVPPHVSCIYVRQPMALGLGHAVLCARPVVAGEPFAVVLADDLIAGDGKPCLQQMAEVFARHRCSVLGAEEVDPSETFKYGIVDATSAGPRLEELTGIVEKPAPAEAPSNLAVVGRYILTPTIFHLLEKVKPGAGGEIQLTDAIAALLLEERILAYRFRGTRYDCGSKLGYLQATVDFALRREELRGPFGDHLRRVADTL